jgi:hypothetical protein
MLNPNQHSYCCKGWNQPQGLYTQCQGWNRKKTFRSTPSTNKWWTLWPCIGPKAEKRIPSNLGGQFAISGVNVLASITNLGPIRNPKMLKVGPKLFWPCLLVYIGPYATHVVFIVVVVCNCFLITNCI